MEFNDFIIYLISLACSFFMAITYLFKTIGKKNRFYYYYIENGEEEFDWDFIKQMIIQLFIIFFTVFTFLNIVYFVFYGKWLSEENMQTSKSFIIIGSVLYIIDTLKSSMKVIREQKRKRKEKNE